MLGVLRHDLRVTLKHRQFYVFDRAASQLGAIRLVAPFHHFPHIKRSRRRPRLKCGIDRTRRRSIVRTHILTNVAAIKPLADRLVKLLRDRLSVLDGEIRNAPPGVELIWLRDRLRWTGVDASRA